MIRGDFGKFVGSECEGIASCCSNKLVFTTFDDLVRVVMYVHSSFLRLTFATWNDIWPIPNTQVMSGKRAVRESGPV